MRNWGVDWGEITFVCLQRPTSADVPPINLVSPEVHLLAAGKTGWQQGELVVQNRLFKFSAYRSRLFISTRIKGQYESVTEFIESEFLPVRTIFETQIESRVPISPGSQGIVWYPVISIPNFCNQLYGTKLWQHWLGDSVASYNYRVFDSRASRAGYVRVSRFSTICIGVGPHIVQDVINLVYERVLYPIRASGQQIPHGQVEQAMANGLSLYTVPTELNIYMQRLAISLATYALMFGIVIAAIPEFTPDPTTIQQRSLTIIAGLGLAWVLGWVVNRLRSRAWR